MKNFLKIIESTKNKIYVTRACSLETCKIKRQFKDKNLLSCISLLNNFQFNFK